MADTVLVIGLGFTGKLVLKHLARHPARDTFKLQAGGRSRPKILSAIDSIGGEGSVAIEPVIFDLANPSEVQKAVSGAHVVINCAGPFYRYGRHVVEACAQTGKHYVDITGETHWIAEMIDKYDTVAQKSGATIVPSCCFDSIPSDLSAYTSVQHLKKLIGPQAQASQSVSAMYVAGDGIGVSGGSAATMFSMLEEVPKAEMDRGNVPYALSPIVGPPVPGPQLIYSLPLPASASHPPIVGGFFIMAPANTNIVRRTWGLLQSRNSPEAYGETFSYDEFMQTPGRMSALVHSLGFFVWMLAAIWLPPFRWLLRHTMPGAGQGPSDDALKNGRYTITNVTSSVPSSASPARTVKTTFIGKGDPGYACGSVMVAECALLLLPHSPKRASLPELGRKGGILTPVTAFGPLLEPTLVKTGMFELEVEEVVGKKDV